ncbi:MAG: ScnB-like protein [Pseudomonadota bacterium]
MSKEDAPVRGYHDLGGTDEGRVERHEHELAPWEKRVDVLRALLADKKRRVLRADGLRSTVETMGESYYTELTYYEKWMEAIRRVTVRRGLLNEEAIDKRMADVAARLDIAPPTPPIDREP